MNFNKIKIKYISKIVIIILFTFFSLTSFAGWQIPNTNPGNSVNSFESPFNTNLSSQQKSGALIIDEGFRSLGPVLFSATTNPLRILASGYGASKVLTSDADGFATWVTPPSGSSNNGWSKAGNLVSLSNNSYNLNLETNTVIHKGGTTSLERFLHNTGNNNLFFGQKAGSLTVTGGSNTALGFESLSNVTSGGQNTSAGSQSLSLNTIGNNNTALGFRALYRNNSGNNNTAIGIALCSNTTGVSNTAIGDRSLTNNTTGSGNTAVGANSLYNSRSQNINVNCDNNGTNYNGNNLTIIGADANITYPTNLSNSTAIGYGASVDANNKVVIGNTSVTIIGGSANWSNFSDIRLKENIQDSDLGLDLIKKLRPVSFNMKSGGDLNYGFIAQEVEEAVGKKTSIVLTDNSKEGYKSMTYGSLIAPLTKAIQEQQEAIEDYKKTIEDYKKRVEYLESLKNKN